MILTAHQPAYLPWLGLFHKIALSDTYVFLDEVQFEKNSFINRNKIKTAGGVQLLTVPIFKTGYKEKTILDMKINNNENWKISHWNSLYLNYKKAPFFSQYTAFFELLYKEEWSNLTDLLIYSLKFLLKELNINTEVIRQSELHTTGKKQDLILEICTKLKPDIFIFGKLGRNYADEEIFKNYGINIYFQNYKPVPYPQLWGEFAPCLSVVDLLFNVGPKNAAEIIMKNNIKRKDLEELFKK